jgi:hypothetical protein
MHGFQLHCSVIATPLRVSARQAARCPLYEVHDTVSAAAGELAAIMKHAMVAKMLQTKLRVVISESSILFEWHDCDGWMVPVIAAFHFPVASIV